VQNFGLNCNYFSKAVDCGLIQQKTEGSLAKSQGRTGIFDSRLLDLDPMAQGGSVPDLIWPVGYGSDG